MFTVLDVGGACPPENIGGVARYQHLLAALTNPARAAHDGALGLLGPDFDPARYR